MTSLFGHVFRREQAPQPIPPLDVALPDDAPPRPQAGRPQLHAPDFIPWSPAMSGPVNAAYDPCGAGPIAATGETP